jgi:phosphate transport system substrate-binding protein
MSKFMSKKGITLALAAVLLMGVGAGCAQKDNTSAGTASPNASATPVAGNEITGTVTASGSSALLPLVKQAASDFMNKNPKVTINVTAGGSGKGVKDVADGNSNIGNSDVEASAEYKDKGLVPHKVAIAPFAIIVSKDVPIDNITKQQAADIYTGKITDWKDIPGAPAGKIAVIHRPDGSGSRQLVKQIILDGKEFTKEGIIQENSGSMRTAVAGQKGSIGYVDTPYVDDTVKALKIDGVAFTEENIKNGTYKMYGVELMYTKGEPTGATKAFIDYIMSSDFQDKQVKALKFLPANLLNK